MNASELADAAIECMRDFIAKLKASGNPPGRIVCPAGGKLALLEQDGFKGNLCRTELVESASASSFVIEAHAKPRDFDKKYSPAAEIVKARRASAAAK